MRRPLLSPQSRFLLAAVIFAVFVLPPASNAQQTKPWEQIPIPPLHAFHPQQPKRIELKNGIVIFLQEDHELPFIYGSVLVPGGSRDEDPAKAGLVGLYSQAWRTSGAASMDGDAMDDLLESKAAHIETEGDDDSTAISWDSLKGDADQVFSLAMDLFFRPKFSAEKLELAKQQEATAIVRRNDDEDAIAGRESAKLVYGVNSPYTRQPELATIGAVTLSDLQAWHDRTLKGKLIVGIYGDFDPAAMEAKVRAAFEGLPPVTPAPPRHDEFPGPMPGVYFIDKEDVNQSNVQIVGLGIDRHNPDVPALAVMNEILGGGFGSRLFRENPHRAGFGLRGRWRLRPAPTTIPAPSRLKPSPEAKKPWTPRNSRSLKSPPSTPGPSPRTSSSAPKTTFSTPSSFATTPKTKSSTRARGSSSMAIRRITLRPTTRRSKK